DPVLGRVPGPVQGNLADHVGLRNPPRRPANGRCGNQLTDNRRHPGAEQPRCPVPRSPAMLVAPTAWAAPDQGTPGLETAEVVLSIPVVRDENPCPECGAGVGWCGHRQYPTNAGGD